MIPRSDLLDIVYRYYPRRLGIIDGDVEKEAVRVSEEHARLVAARRKAATDERWHAMQRRMEARFPDAPLVNYSLHLPTGDQDACYSYAIPLSDAADARTLWFQVSFLAPYYIIFSSRLTDSEIVTSPRGFDLVFHGAPVHLPESAVSSGLLLNPDDEDLKSVTIKRRDFAVTFDLSPDERPYGEWIAREIEATFDWERMPPEIGTVLVPDVATNMRPLGEARLYDCLFSDSHQWVKPSAREVWAPALEIDANRLTDRAIAVVTVLAALFHIVWTLMPKTNGAFSGTASTDGVLRKEELLNVLATWIRPRLDPTTTPRGIAARPQLEAATRELEELLAAWDGNGAPSDAMVAWASSFLASWDADKRE